MAENKAKAQEAKAKGNAAFSAQNFEEAIKHFSEAISHDPADHVFYSNRSACFASLNKYEEAKADAEKCVELKPDWSKGYSRLGLALYHLDDYKNAEAAYSKGLELDPSNAQLKEGLEQVKAATSKPSGMFGPEMMQKIFTTPSLQPFLGQPDFLMKLQDIQKNPQNITKHLNDPRIMQVLSTVMGVDLKMGGDEDVQMSDASPPRQEPHRQEPKPQPKQEAPKAPEPPRELTEEEKQKAEAEREKDQGNTHYKARRFAEALQHYTRAMELDETDMTYLMNRAAVYLEMGETDKCVEDCQTAIEKGRAQRADYKKIAKAYARIGNAYLKAKKYAEAIDAFKKSLVEDRDDAVRTLLKKTEKMKEEADQAAYLDPVKAEEHRNAGNECFKNGAFPDAIREYTEAARRNPNDARIYSNRAACFQRLMDFPAALKDAEKALQLDPNFVKAFSRKGNIHFAMKEFHKALAAFESGLKLDPQNQECKEGMQRTMHAVQAGSSNGEADQERIAHAMADPEIQAILRDPNIMQVLKDFQENPAAARGALKDPDVAKALDKLIAAGVLQVGR
eukprot:GILK01000461.1.p1 GENE.GILK01000461.1~~GILK01000461.1.p1  ORF type:complete len:564 (-),score=115.90 GILK01000461.1:110-1801(-)